MCDPFLGCSVAVQLSLYEGESDEEVVRAKLEARMSKA